MFRWNSVCPKQLLLSKLSSVHPIPNPRMNIQANLKHCNIHPPSLDAQLRQWKGPEQEADCSNIGMCFAKITDCSSWPVLARNKFYHPAAAGKMHFHVQEKLGKKIVRY